MNYNQEYGVTPKMEDSILSLYYKIMAVLDRHCKINFNAMNSMHAIGYNGFKRWHKINNKKYHEYKAKLANELFDKYRKKCEFEGDSILYAPTSMQEHLMKWDELLAKDIKLLGELNKEHLALIGTENCIIKHVLKCMCYDYEKVGRYHKRFIEGDWLVHDMHIVDDCIHAKMKKREEKHNPY